MATGMAIHIGLDNLDPDAYAGWDGALAACENDASSMEELARSVGYRTQTLLTSDARAETVFGAIQDAAVSLKRGDICLITYAGHGGQFADLNGDEEQDRLDETWLLYDREVLDDEIRVALSAFHAGVRVVVLSDSCHSGTVTRAQYERMLDTSSVRHAYERVAPWLLSRSGIANRGLRLRGAPADIQKKVLDAHRALYEGIRASTPKREETSVAASAILISGCQDNQESAEENGHGVFTAALLEHWGRGAFSGDYHALRDAILRDLPPTQSPNLFTTGTPWVAFEKQVPFTIDPPEFAGGAGEQGGGESDSGSGDAPLVQVVTAQSDVVVVKFKGSRGT